MEPGSDNHDRDTGDSPVSDMGVPVLCSTKSGAGAAASASESTSRKPGPLDMAGRVTGFLLLAVPSMAVLAAMVLLPAYRNLQQHRYELACLEVAKLEKEDLANTRDRLIYWLPLDERLTMQLVIQQTNLTPADAEVVIDPSRPTRNPLRITIPPRPLPPPPNDRWLTLGNIIEQPRIRAGLALMAFAGLIGSLFMFSPNRGKAT